MNKVILTILEEELLRRYGEAKTYKFMHSDISPRDLVRSFANESFAFFCRAFLPQYFKLPYGPMHLELSDDVDEALRSTSGWRELLIWPRGFGKSSHICTGLGIYSCALRKRPYICIVKNSFQSQAEPEISAIREELQYNDELNKFFGPFKGKSWGKGDIITAGRWPDGGVKVQGFGVGMRIRGAKHGPHRPGIVIMDDLETLESVESRDQRDKIRGWHDRDAMQAGLEPGADDECLYFDIGTNLHTDCLVANLLKRPAWRHRFWQAELNPAKNMILWDKWKTIVCDLSNENRLESGREFFNLHRDEMLEGTKVSWPDGYDYYRLALIKLGEQKVGESVVSSFEAEMQNNPISASERIFTEMHYYRMEDRQGELWLVPEDWGKPVPFKDCELYGACDPSMGETGSSDYSAIIILAVAPWGQKFTVVADIKRRPPSEIIETIFKYTAGREVQCFAIESNGFQRLMYSNATEAAMERNDYVPFLPITATGNKIARIKSLQPDLLNSYVLLNREHTLLNEQLFDFPRGAHDDGVDALELAVRIANQAGSGGGVMI
ncbi:MAG: phage terminase large subunit [Chloroflexi bacterium]|nr:phage terminase large subunit [Chloroflexota bacterium]